MKNFTLLILLYVITAGLSLSAQVAINSDGSAPDNSAMLDIDSDNKGVLVPRINFVNRPQSPALGLLVYVTENGPQGNNVFYYWDGGEWIAIPDRNLETRLTNIENTLALAGLLYVSDYDGNSYFCRKIGNKIWMTENLRATHFMNGDEIPTTTDPNQPIGGIGNPAFQWAYEGNEQLVPDYGRLYTFYVTTHPAGVCPSGFHIPTVEDWMGLDSYYGSENAGGALKETGYEHWEAPNTGATNESQFNARPSGTRYNDIFMALGQSANYWSSTVVGPSPYNVYISSLSHVNAILWWNGYNISETKACSIRCVKDLP